MNCFLNTMFIKIFIVKFMVWQYFKRLGIGPGCGITLQKMSAGGRPRPINKKLIKCAILRFLIFFLSLETYPSWVSIKTLSCGQSYFCIPIIVICILHFVFYNINAIIDLRISFSTTKRLDRHP